MPHRAKDYRLAHHPQDEFSIVVPEKIIARMRAQSVLDPATGCLNYTTPNARNPDNDAYANLNWNNKEHTIALHRLALIVATDAPAPSPYLLALHSCENRRCVNGEHLRWGTAQDNADDYWMLRRPRWPAIVCEEVAEAA